MIANEDYVVEEVIGKRKKGNGFEYLVRWAPTWERKENLNCRSLIKEFKSNLLNKKFEDIGNHNDKEEDNDDSDERNEHRESSVESSVAPTDGFQSLMSTMLYIFLLAVVLSFVAKVCFPEKLMSVIGQTSNPIPNSEAIH